MLEDFNLIEVSKGVDGYSSWLGDRYGKKVQVIMRTTDSDNDISTLDVSAFVPGTMLCFKKAFARVNAGGFITISVFGLDNVEVGAVDDAFPMDCELFLVDPGMFFSGYKPFLLR